MYIFLKYNWNKIVIFYNKRTKISHKYTKSDKNYININDRNMTKWRH